MRLYFFSIGNEKIWIFSQSIKIRFVQGTPAKNLGYNLEKMKGAKEKLQDYKTSDV